LFKIPQLIWVNKVICNQVVLQSFADGFFYQFFYYVEQENRAKRLGRVIGGFVWFKNNDEQQHFEM